MDSANRGPASAGAAARAVGLPAGPRPGHPPLPRVAWRPVGAALLALLVVLVVTINRYGYHRDELYFRLLPPRWGYVDQPPLTPMVVRLVTSALGDHLWALRTPATLLGAGSVLVMVLVARELGGSAWSQGLVAWGFGFATLTLTFAHVMLTASWDLVLWPAIVLLVLRVVRRDDPRWWLPAGALVGLSTYNKWLVVLLVVAILVSLLVFGPRRALRSWWLPVAAGVALLVALPNLGYQLRHGLPQLAMGRALSADNAADVRVTMWPLLLAEIGPLVCWVWILGLARLARDPAWRSARFLLGTFVVVLLLTFAGGSQIYYPYPVLGVVFTVGCVALEPALTRRRVRLAVLALFGAGVATNVVINLPVIGVGVVGRTPIVAVNQSVGDQVGWPRYVAQVDAVVVEARRSDPGTVVLASNYGEAGALGRFSAVPGLRVVSAHNALWDEGPPPPDTRTVVVVGGQYARLTTLFTHCAVRARLDNGVGVDNEEQGKPVGICTGPRQSWALSWPELRHLS